MTSASPVTVLGIRTAPQQIRYAIVHKEDGVFTLVNQDTESLLPRPVACEDSISTHLLWVHDEIIRILRQNPTIARVAIKLPEFAGTQSLSSRLGNYLDAAVMLAAQQNAAEIFSKLYSQLATSRSKVKEHAESRVGRTPSHWDVQMADAVAVAWMAFR